MSKPRKLYWVRDLLSMQDLYFKNFKSAIEHPESPITCTLRNAQRIKADKVAEQEKQGFNGEFASGFPIIVDGCRIDLLISVD